MTIAQKIVDGNTQPQKNNATVSNSLGNRAAGRVTTNEKRSQIDLITDDTVAHINTRFDGRMKRIYT